MFKVTFINDWKYLFNKNAMGGRFASFTFVQLAWLNTGFKGQDDSIDIDGLSVVLIGIGVRIRRK